MSKKILIAGYYGFGNTGDEAILAAMLQDLQGLSAHAMIVVVSGNPAQTEKEHGVKAVPWRDIEQITRSVQDCDLVLIGGGGIFHDYWGLTVENVLTSNHIGIPFYSSIALLASMLEKPLMLYAVGVGPLTSDAGKLHVRAIVEQASIISVRDTASRDQILALGVAHERLHVTADPVFRLPVSLNEGENKRGIIDGCLVLGVALRNWDVGVNPDQWEQQAAEAIDFFLDTQHDASVVFIPFQDQNETLLDDFGCAERVQRKMRNAKNTRILDRACSLVDKATVLEQCDLVLGMRLHALILAARSGIPMVGLVYDPKVRNLMGQIGMGAYAMDLAEMTSTSLNHLLEEAFRQRDQLTIDLRAASSFLTEKAYQNVQFTEELLTASPPGRKELSPAAQEVMKKAALSLSQLFEASSIQNRLKTEKILQLQAQHRSQIGKFTREIADLQATLAHTEAQYEREMAGLKAQLAEIKNSRGWKLLWVFWEIRLFLIPLGSKRERFLSALWRGLHSLVKYLLRSIGGFLRRLERKCFGRASRHADVFLRFKQQRQEKIDPDLSGLQISGQKGLVSIVLPVYNGAAYIADALDSILAQTYQHFEVIVVNDGSQDNTPEILAAYAKRDQRILVVHQENQKLPNALNHGFRLAKGEYLTWTSHDNRMKSDFLEKMVDCLSRHPAWDMVYANMDIIGEDGAALRDSVWYAGYQQPAGSEHIYLPVDIAELNTRPNNFIGGAFLYRNRVQWLIGDYSPYQYTREDYDYWMRVNGLLTLRHVDFREPVYEYRFHSDSLTSDDDALGITRDRKYLMAFDDFRRDFYTMPLVWFIDDEDILDSQSADEGKVLRDHLLCAGHLVFDISYSHNNLLPKLWLPYVYLKITTNSHSRPTRQTGLPDSALNVLLYVKNEQLPDTVHQDWQMCLSLGATSTVPRLANDRQGWWVSRNMQILVNAVDIYARSRHLDLIQEEISQQEPEPYKVSVIICTYQRDQGLEHALRSIARQSMLQREYEVLVVDNNPGDSGAEAVVEKVRAEAFQECPGHLRLLHCPVLGLSFARNVGIAEAKSDVLLFMDDDATAKEDLLEQYWKAFSQNLDTGVIGGHIFLERPEHLSMIWKEGWERYWSQFITGHEEYTKVEHWWEFPWGANWAARRKALMQVGGFRGKYGRRAEDFHGGEEIVAASLIQRLGYTVGVLPQAEVVHHVEEKRFTLEHLRKTIRAGMFVRYQAQLDLYLPVDTHSGISFKQHVVQMLGRLISLPFHPNDPVNKASFVETRFQLSARWQLLKYQLNVYFQQRHRQRIWKKKL